MIPHRLFKTAQLVATALLLGACASHTIQINDPHHIDLRSLERWQAKGKLSIKAHSQAKSANFDWKQSTPNFNILIYGALGIGSARLDGNADEVKLTTSKEEMFSHSAEGLMHTALGWSVPVSELRHWIKGTASPDNKIDDHTLDLHGRLEQLNQLGWDIQYTQYHQAGQLYLPKKIVAQRDDVKLIIVITSWVI